MDEHNNIVTDFEANNFSIQEFEFCDMLDYDNDDIGRSWFKTKNLLY